MILHHRLLWKELFIYIYIYQINGRLSMFIMEGVYILYTRRMYNVSGGPEAYT